MPASHREDTQIGETVDDPRETGFELEDAFVAPWGLANAERPMHLLWNGRFETVEIRFFEPIQPMEGHNIAEEIDAYETEDGPEENSARIFRFPAEDFITPGYFSAKFIVPEIFDEAMVGAPIQVVFELSGGQRQEWEGYSFTIRPQLEVVKSPNEFMFDDDSDDQIDIQMRYIGFGMAQVDIEVWSEGELISSGKSIYHDIIDAWLESGIHEMESDELEPVPEEWEEKAGYKIPQEDIEDIVDDLREMITHESMFDNYDMDELSKIADILEEGGDEHDASEFYKYIEMMLVNSILDVVDRHPADDVQLKNPHTKIEAESRIREAVVKYNLQDSHGNKYDPIEVLVDVDGTREVSGPIEIEVNTEWEHHHLNPKEILDEIQDEL